MKINNGKIKFNIIFSSLICLCCIFVLAAIFIFSNQNIKSLVAFMIVTIVFAIISLAMLVFALIKYHRTCVEDREETFEEEEYIKEHEHDIVDNEE